MNLAELEIEINKSKDGIILHEAHLINYVISSELLHIRAAVESGYLYEYDVENDNEDVFYIIDCICMKPKYTYIAICGSCAYLDNEILSFGDIEDGKMQFAFSPCCSSESLIQFEKTKVIWKVIKKVHSKDLEEIDTHDFFDIPGSYRDLFKDPSTLP